MDAPTLRAGRPGYTAAVAPSQRVPSLEELTWPTCLLIAPEGRVGWHNEGFGAWAGRPDVLGAALGEIFPGDVVIARLWEEARAHAAVEHHVERRGPDGAASFWSVRARRTEGGVLVCATDLTAFAEAAHALHAVQQTFVAAAAHELRAPLSAIKAWASALGARRRGGPMAADEPLLDDGLVAITRQVDRMNELLSDLLEAARSDTAALRATRAAVPIADLLERAVDAAPSAGRVTLGALPDARVLVDPRQLEVAFARIAAAVAKRQPEGPIAVTGERDELEVRVMIADGGPPLAPAVEADVFGRVPRPGRGRGVGLGLHVAQLLIARSGGRVWRERAGYDGGRPPMPPGPAGSAGPAGDRYVLALPAEDAAVAPRSPGPLRVLVSLREEGGILGRAASILRLYGHHVVTAPSLAPFAAGDFDLVLVDLLRPAAGGVAALAPLRARPDPPVILVTAPAGPRPDALAGAERAGAFAVLPEPIDWAHLLALVQTTAAARGAA
jgi:signal transduction histidine kinase/CheY-like chemotaxis protein